MKSVHVLVCRLSEKTYINLMTPLLLRTIRSSESQ